MILLPTALRITSITDRRAGVWALSGRVFCWRFGIGWWLGVLFCLPVIALLLGLILGGRLHTADLGPVLVKQLASILLAVVVITCLDAHFNFVKAAVLTSLPFARGDSGNASSKGRSRIEKITAPGDSAFMSL